MKGLSMSQYDKEKEYEIRLTLNGEERKHLLEVLIQTSRCLYLADKVQQGTKLIEPQTSKSV